MEMNIRRMVMIIGMAVIIAALGLFFVWKWFGGYLEYRNYNDMEKRYVQAMTADKNGGKTPQETLNMFVDALKKEDVELAASYFMLDDNLSRDKWIETLAIFKEKGLLDDMAGDLGKSKEDIKNRIDENDYKFNIYNDDGTVGGWIDMRFNNYSKVWKIESL